MSHVSTLRAAIRAAITTLVPAADLKDVVLPEHSFAAAIRKPTVTLAYGGKPKRTPGPISQRDRNGLVYRWYVTVVDEELRTASGAVLAAEETTEALLGLRTQKLGTIGRDPVYLVFLEETQILGPARGDEGGAIGLVMAFETTEVLA